MSVIINPIEQYFDVDGSPLQSGYLYFGEVYGNPVTQPVMVYFDPDFTIPAAQPVRTVNGYPVRNGTATGLFAPDDVSIIVQNSKKEQVIYIQSSAIDTGNVLTVYRDTNISLNADDNNRTFILLSPITQTFDASANLGDRWRVDVINMSGGNVILNPYLSETIDGQATLTLTENQTITIYCDGVNLFTNLLSIKLVPDEAYNASTWNGSLKVPTQNAVRDAIETLVPKNIVDFESGVLVNRQNTTTEGGNISLARALDNAPSWDTDVVGSATDTSYRLTSRNFSGTGTVATILQIDNYGNKVSVIPRIPSSTVVYREIPCRATARFGSLGGTLSINSNDGFSTIQRLSVGQFRLFFATTMPDNAYVVNVTAGNTPVGTPIAHIGYAYAYNTTYFDIAISDNNTDQFFDSEFINVTVHR